MNNSSNAYLYIIIGLVCVLSYLGYRYIKSTQDNITKVNEELSLYQKNLNDLSEFVLSQYSIQNHQDMSCDIQSESKQNIQREPIIKQKNISKEKLDNDLPNLTKSGPIQMDNQSILSDMTSVKNQDIKTLDDFVISINNDKKKKKKGRPKKKVNSKNVQESSSLNNQDSPKIEEIINNTTQTSKDLIVEEKN